MKDIRPGAPTARDVSCPHCEAKHGHGCKTPKGNVAPIHQARWTQLRYARSHGMVVQILADNLRLRLLKGERYQAAPYSLDPGIKAILTRRVEDGHDPECTQYWHEVAFIGWLDPRFKPERES